jgi:hypothetical protein
MRAGMSFVRLGLAGLGKFVVLTSALSIAMFVAVTGPPTPSETASVSAAAGHVVRRFDSAALHFTFDLCDSIPVAAHAAGVCGRPSAAAVARVEHVQQRAQVVAISETRVSIEPEVLPPDAIDQIARPLPRHTELLDEGPARTAHVHPTRTRAVRASSAHAAPRHVARVSAHTRQAAHPHPVRARLHRTAPPVHVVRAAPIAAPPRRPPIHVTPVAPAAHATASAPPTQGAPSPGSAEPLADDKDTKS